MSENRESIIRSVKTPLAFFTLLVLITEGVLVAVAARVTGLDLTLIVVGIFLILFTLIVAVVLTARGKIATTEPADDPKKRKYDVFFSSVLAGFNDDSRLAAEKEGALTIIKSLERDCGFTVYYAGRDVTSISDFDGTPIGARRDLEALRDSRFFIMLYPERITSSVLFEAGYALQRCETSVYLVRNTDDLPYLMRRLPELHSSFVRILKYKRHEDIVRMIDERRTEIFAWDSSE